MTVLAEFVFLLLMAIGCWDGLGGKMALNLDPECDCAQILLVELRTLTTQVEQAELLQPSASNKAILTMASAAELVSAVNNTVEAITANLSLHMRLLSGIETRLESLVEIQKDGQNKVGSLYQIIVVTSSSTSLSVQYSALAIRDARKTVLELSLEASKEIAKITNITQLMEKLKLQIRTGLEGLVVVQNLTAFNLHDEIESSNTSASATTAYHRAFQLHAGALAQLASVRAIQEFVADLLDSAVLSRINLLGQVSTNRSHIATLYARSADDICSKAEMSAKLFSIELQTVSAIINDAEALLNNSFTILSKVHVDTRVSDSLVTWLEANVTSLESLLADFYSVERGMAVVLEHLFGLNSQLVAMRRLSASLELHGSPEKRLAPVQAHVQEAVVLAGKSLLKLGQVVSLRNSSFEVLFMLKMLLQSLDDFAEIEFVDVNSTERKFSTTMSAYIALTQKLNKTAAAVRPFNPKELTDAISESYSFLERSEMRLLALVRPASVTASLKVAVNETIKVLKDAEDIIGTQLSGESGLLEAASRRIDSIDNSLQETAHSLTQAQTDALFGEQTYNHTIYLLQQSNVAVSLPKGVPLLPSIPPQVLSLLNGNGDFQSLSITCTLSIDRNCTLIQLIAADQNQMSASISVGVVNMTWTTLFECTRSTVSSGSESVQLRLPGIPMIDSVSYKITIARASLNAYFHVVVGSDTYRSAMAVSSQLAECFKSGFLDQAQLQIGGNITSRLHLASKAGSCTGCASTVTTNGYKVNLWRADTTSLPGRSCSQQSSLQPVLVAFRGEQYLHAELNGSIFPLHMRMRTQHPNSLLLFARNEREASSLQISLRLGYLVVQVVAGTIRRTLTSTYTYNSGSLQGLTVTLSSPSMRRLLLITEQEESRRGLQRIEPAQVSNYTEVFVGGAPAHVGSELEAANFSGCALLMSSPGLLSLPLPRPSRGKLGQEGQCSYCNNEVVSTIHLYGIGGVMFSAISIGDHFSVRLSFRTRFSDGLLLFVGASSEAKWLALLLVDTIIHVVFESTNGRLDLPAKTVRLDDNQWHEVVLERATSNVQIFVDGVKSAGFPFAGFFIPSGAIGPSLHIGGIVAASSELFPTLLTYHPFIGSLNGVSLSGTPIDFTAHVALEAAILDLPFCKSINRSCVDECFFNGKSFAEFDIGRVGTSLLVGLQLQTTQPSSLLLFVFSQRTDDLMVIWIEEGQLQVLVTDGEGTNTTHAQVNVSDGRWHSVSLSKEGPSLTMIIDTTTSVDLVAPADLRTHSQLYIGGLPDGIRTPLPRHISSQNFVGCLRANILPLSKPFRVSPGLVSG